MWRVVGAVIVGYILMFVIVFILLTGLFLAMGTDGAFQEGTFVPSTVWIGLMFVVGLTAAIGGGFVCAAIAPASKAPVALVVVVLVLGVLSAIPAFMPPDADQPTERSGELGNMEAMMQARTPKWVALLNPIVGVLGVMIGARLKGAGADAG